MSPASAASFRQAFDLLKLAKRDLVAVESFQTLHKIDFAVIAFHAQQCIKKCMKAVLSKHEVIFPRTHDLDDLCEMLTVAGIETPVSRELLNDITPYAVTSRYEVDAEDLVTIAQVNEAVTKTVSWASSQLNPQ